MGKKQKKKNTRRKEIFQRTWIPKIKEDESDSDWGPNCLIGTMNGDDSEEYAIVLEDQQRIFNEKESASKALMINDIYNPMKGIEADLEKENKKNERLEVEIISLREDPKISKKKIAELEAETISLKTDLEKSNKKNEELKA